MAILVDLKPFAEPNEQKDEVISEVNCLLVLWFLVLFTFSGIVIQDPYLRESIGFVLVSTQVLFIVAIIILLLFSAMKAIYRVLKVKYLKREASNKQR